MAKKIKSYSETELILMFALIRKVGNEKHPLMQQWTDTTYQLSDWEKALFNYISHNVAEKIAGWNEEMLKMNFISPVLILADLTETEHYKNYYENTIEATVGNYFLKVKTDMMIAKGVMEKPQMPYFYFQEYKRQKDPNGDVVGQLLEAFLIAQTNNKNDMPLYGCTVSGKYWEFFVMENKTYCISKSYDCTDKEDLLQIIAILRKFKEILETRLLDKS